MASTSPRTAKSKQSIQAPEFGGAKPEPGLPAEARGTIDLPLTLILIGSAVLRMAHLSYSHFQGDEIKALYPQGASFPEFLFRQNKGPVQFLVTLLVRSITGDYTEWVTRLPFSVASLLSVYVMYRLVREEFGRQPALFSAGLLGSCGLFVAFGRIVQYQSWCILFMLLAGHFLLRWLRTDDPRLLYAGLPAYALALLSHYDALTVGPALGLLVVAGLRRGAPGAHPVLGHLVRAGAIGAILVGLFYVPYVLNPSFPTVRDYLLGRIFAGSGDQTFEVAYDLLGLYLPPFYMAFAIPLLAWGSVSFLRRRRDPRALFIPVWFATAFIFYMLLGGDPRSHIYNYLLPALVLVAIGMDAAAMALRSGLFQTALRTVLWGLLTAFGVMTYAIVVDHTIEHPWYAKTVFGYPLPNLETQRIAGVFGFPFRRGLPQVGERFRSGQLRGSYDSNERDVMTDYYFHATRALPPDYYIYVFRPLSLDGQLPEYVARDYRRIEEISVGGRKTIEIYEAPHHAGQVPRSRRTDPPGSGGTSGR